MFVFRFPLCSQLRSLLAAFCPNLCHGIMQVWIQPWVSSSVCEQLERICCGSCEHHNVCIVRDYLCTPHPHACWVYVNRHGPMGSHWLRKRHTSRYLTPPNPSVSLPSCPFCVCSLVDCMNAFLPAGQDMDVSFNACPGWSCITIWMPHFCCPCQLHFCSFLALCALHFTPHS